jgi:hypothetical protein
MALPVIAGVPCVVGTDAAVAGAASSAAQEGTMVNNVIASIHHHPRVCEVIIDIPFLRLPFRPT